MKAVFLDTVGLIAIWERSDQWHAAATQAFRKLLSKGEILVTTPYVLMECANSAARRPFRQDVVNLRRDLAAAGCLISPTQAEEEGAWTSYSRANSGGPGVVDHISFAVMRRLGITESFTNDRHFSAAGFVALF